jgi:hypothetical protein
MLSEFLTNNPNATPNEMHEYKQWCAKEYKFIDEAIKQQQSKIILSGNVNSQIINANKDNN